MFKKCASGMLALFLILGLVNPAFAEEVSETTTESGTVESTEATPDTTTATEESENVTIDLDYSGEEAAVIEEGSEELAGGEQMAMLGAGGTGDGSGVGGAGNQKLSDFRNSISTLDGAFTYMYPISIPPGRNGVQPNISLAYNSNSANDDDQFGYGWSVTIPYIERLNKTGVKNLVSADSFFSSLSGELEHIQGTDDYVAKVETGDFMRYTYVSNVWTVTTKEGLVYRFGSASSSRQDSVASSSQIFKWMVDEVRDTDDNYISYEYFKADGNIYPDTISYTHHATSSGEASIEFTHTPISVNEVQYDTGFGATTTYRISTIETFFDNERVRLYDLAYTSGDNGSRSMLDTITETGRDEVSSTTKVLPPLDVTYQGTMSDGWSASSSLTIPVPFVTSDGKDLGARIADFNGDGYPDIARYFVKSGQADIKQMYLNNHAGGWTLNTSWDWSDVPLPFVEYNGSSGGHDDKGVRFADVNGDGFTDLLTAYSNGGTQVRKVLFGNGAGWVEDANWTIPVYFTNVYSSQARDGGARIGDVNGDGLPDIVVSYINSGSSHYEDVYVNRGDRWALDSSLSFPEPFVSCPNCSSTGIDYGTHLIDINSDGLDDVVRGFESTTYGNVNKAYINTGSGWVYKSNWSVPTFIDHDATIKDQGFRLVDINSDGLVDITVSESNSSPDVFDTYINNGKNWTNAIGQVPPSPIPFANEYGDSGTRYADINADGLPDIIKSYSSGTGSTVTGDDVYLSDRNVGDALTTLVLPTGGAFTVQYKTSAEFKNTGGNILNPNLPYLINAVSTITYEPDIGVPWSEEYTYEGGLHWYDDDYVTDKKFAGFHIVTKTTGHKIEKTYYHQGSTTNSGAGETSDSYYKIGFPYREEVTDLLGNTHRTVVHSWEENDLGSYSSFVKKSDTLVLDYDGDSDHRDSAVSYTYDSTHGSPLVMTEWGEVDGNSDGTFSDIGSDKRITTYAYATTSISGGTGGGGEEHRFLEWSLFGHVAGWMTGLLSSLFDGDEPLNQVSTQEPLDSFVTEERFDGVSPIVIPLDNVVPTPNLLDRLSTYEKVNAKVSEIMKVKSLPRQKATHENAQHDIEVVDVEAITGGVQVLARAWSNDGEQVGFGVDGSVDIERFLIYNPPILVPDSQGDIRRTSVNKTTGEIIEWNLRKDPEQALLQVLDQAIGVKQQRQGSRNIKLGRVGNTTSIFYSESDPASVGGDGSWSSHQTSWSTARSTTSAAFETVGTFSVQADQVSGSDWRLGRGYLNFDTSSLSSAHATSAVLTVALAGNGISDVGMERDVVLVKFLGSIPDSTAHEFGLVGETIDSPTEGANRINLRVPDVAGTKYNFVLNNDGISWINHSGVTRLGMRNAHDVDNTLPNNGSGRAQLYQADQTGSTNDPTLIVEHAYVGTAVRLGQLVVPKQITTVNQASTTVRDQKFYFDTLSFGTVDIGNLTKREDWATSSTWTDTEWTYNGQGNILTEKNAYDNTITYVYDSYNLFPATTTNELGHVTKTTYDYSSGKVKRTTDPAGRIFESVYDPLDRVTAEYVPDPLTGSSSLKTVYTYTDTQGSLSVKRDNYLGTATSTRLYTYLDGFARPYQERIEAEGSNQFAVRDFVYGTDGFLKKESLPYFSTSASSTASTSDSDLYTEYGYDALGRVVIATTTVGTSSTTYDEWVEIKTDVLGNVKEFIYDAYKRLKEVDEHNGTSTYTTTYEWDANSNLTKITDALGNIRNFTYDGLNRRLLAQDLHGASDTTFGTWYFSYDLVGNLVWQMDPKNQEVEFSYDALNRPLTEDYTGGVGTEVRYTYDSCTRGTGKLCVAVNNGATTSLSYDYLGHVATETRAISGTSYTTKYEYDRQGNKTRIIYPDNSEVMYVYNKGNRVEQVRQKESGGSFANVISNFDYGPHGMVTYQLHGNGASTTKTYDATELYRLRSIVTTSTTTGGTGGPGEGFAAIEEELLATPVSEETPLSEMNTEEDTVTETIVEETVASTTTTEALPVDVEVVPSEVIGTTTDDTATTTETTSTTSESILDSVLLDTPTTTPSLDIAVTTLDVATTTLEVPLELLPEVKIDTKTKDKLITDSHEARVWQNFHKERVEGLVKEGAPQETIDSALYAQDQFESYLLEKGYTNEKKGEVKSPAKDFFKKLLENVVEEIISFILPETAYAYLFGLEDFETCSSLPCSFSSHPTWGSVTGSLDNTSKAVGVDSYKTVTTGEGSASLEAVNYNRDEIWVQFKVYIPSTLTFGVSDYFSILRFEDSANGSIFRISVEDWGTARLTIAGDTLSWTNTGLDLTKGATNTIEVRFKKGTTNGDVDIWLNNSTQGSPSYNGSGTLNTGTDNVDDVLIGMYYAPENGISTLYFDDMAIDSGFVGTASGGGGAPTEPFRSKLQDLTYTYDAAGNITQLVDASYNITAATTSYQYDDLYRLTRASTTQASSTPYVQTYTYNAIGNLITKSDVGTYSYEGDQGGSGQVTQALYSDSVASGWADQSWASAVNPSDTSPVQSGTYSLGVTYGSAWQGLRYKHNSVDTSAYDTLDLAVNVGTSTSINLYLYFRNSSETLLTVVELDTYNGGSWSANTWEDISIPLADIDMDNYTGTTSFHIESDGVAVVNFDNIEFVGSGGGAPNYANPHAPTTINGVSQTYDNNGNLTSTGAGLANTWNYQNRLIQSHGGGTASTTYLYDHTGQRTSKTSNSITTHYPSALYEAQGATTTKHVYVGDQVVATIQSDTPGPKTFHNHLDHLGSTNVVSTPDGHLNQEMAYYPFGSPRITNQYGELNQKNRYIGQDFDEESSLSYLNARYYDGQRGQFISQDPMFWSTNQNLMDPQTLNSYSYASNNPINRKDPSGLKSKQSEATIRAEIRRLQNQILGLVKQQLQQMADDLVRGARNGTVNPVRGAKAAVDSSRSAPERVGSAVGSAYGSVLYTAGAVAYTYGLARAPVPTIGGTVAVAERYTNDRRNGTRSTPQQYVGSALFGVTSGRLTQHGQLTEALLLTGGVSALENLALEKSLQPHDVVSDVFAATAARLTGYSVSTPQVAPLTQATIEGITEFTTYSSVMRLVEGFSL